MPKIAGALDLKTWKLKEVSEALHGLATAVSL
jgi:hypothetical protein